MLRPKTKTTGNSSFLITSENSTLFLINPWTFLLLFLQYPREFTILYLLFGFLWNSPMKECFNPPHCYSCILVTRSRIHNLWSLPPAHSTYLLTYWKEGVLLFYSRPACPMWIYLPQMTCYCPKCPLRDHSQVILIMLNRFCLLIRPPHSCFFRDYILK